MRTEVDRMPHIFGFGKDAPDNITTPVIRVGKFLLAFPNALVLFAKVNGRRFYLIVIENTGNIIRAFALNGQIRLLHGWQCAVCGSNHEDTTRS